MEAATLPRRSPSDRERLQFANALATLDPTPRRLTSAEKFRRSTELIARTQTALQSCGDGGATNPLVEAAGRELAKRPHAITNEITEEWLSLASRLWDERARVCPQRPAHELVATIIDKVGEQ